MTQASKNKRREYPVKNTQKINIDTRPSKPKFDENLTSYASKIIEKQEIAEVALPYEDELMSIQTLKQKITNSKAQEGSQDRSPKSPTQEGFRNKASRYVD